MEHSSNNNWLTLLRRKIQKKFKRNRQKVNNNVTDEISQENQIVQEEINQIPEDAAAAEQQIVDTATTEESNSLSHNCEEMKKELFKLNWYWPGLK